MSWTVEDVDVHDEPALRAWWEVGHAASADRAHGDWPAWELSRTALPADNPERDLTLLAFGDPAVGSAMVALPVRDNPHLAFVSVWVQPDHRRRGIGSALLAATEARVRAAGRTTLLHDGTSAPESTAGLVAFAAAHGFEVAGEEERKVVTAADGERLWPALEQEVAEHLGGYRIVQWVTDVPEEWVEPYGRLISGFFAEVPLGEVDLQDSDWTPERIRANAARAHAIGLEFHTALALAPDGTPAGCSDARINRHTSDRAAVGITLVDPAHRGHRLGLALKLATHRAVLAAHPECTWLDTCNARVNAHMNAINERLGYVVVEDQLDLQKKL